MAIFKGNALKELEAKKIKGKGTAAPQKKINGKQPKAKEDQAGEQGKKAPCAVWRKGRKTAVVRAKKAV